MTTPQYLEKLNTRFRAGISTEHSYRGDLQNLLESLAPDILVTNEPSRVACGAPDYILTKKNIPIGYIEAKDIGADLENKIYKEQFDRYKAGLHNLIITDYLNFRLYRDGVFVTSIAIANIDHSKIVGDPVKYQQFEDLIKDFSTHVSQTIRSAEKLSRMMAGKARMLATVIEKALVNDETDSGNIVYEAENTSLKEQLTAFKQVLIHDINPKEFSDIYAQTITYGMFAARLHDPSLDTFTRQEAAELIPKTNPFLRKLFQYIAGYDLDDRLKWIVDALADIFRATDVAELLKNFGKATQQNDPMIHFYETFLGEYDPKLRKSRGVWYTPEPVVNFIVRAVDDILKTEFGLKDGLADISKTKVKVKIPTHDYRMKVDGQKGYTEVEQEVHKVQILDPAAGTGTFLADIIKHIYKNFEGQQGIWSQYVDEHLIPRLNGFEILMASYAMAHLKLDLLLAETGYKPQKDQRFRVFLTNSLEEYHPDTGTLFAGWLSSEANEANHVKRDTPVMVVLGNPPYSVSSSNKSEWIENLMVDYKKDLNERNIQPLSDDYIKFIRFGQHFIDKNGEGILAYISNNSFLDGIIHRQMRKYLLESFDKGYIIDLHGNSKLKEITFNGKKDENVFDIQQGVSINIFIKNSRLNKKSNPKIFHCNLFGTRNEKYNVLLENKIEYVLIDPKPPFYFFNSKDYTLKSNYDYWFQINELFNTFSGGIQTKRDKLFLETDLKALTEKIKKLLSGELEQSFIEDYNIKNSSSYSLLDKIKKVHFNESLIRRINYFPFDSPYIYYDRDLIGRSFYNNMHNFLGENNLGLVVPKQNKETGGGFITNRIIGQKLFSAYDINYAFPLYLYSENTEHTLINQGIERTPNLNMKIVGQMVEKLGLQFTTEKEEHTPKTFAPIDILDYIYAILHSPTYREKYNEFLKIDFPRVPCPKDPEIFWKLVALGGQLRQIHLLESLVVNRFITTYPVTGNNIVFKLRFEPIQSETHQFTISPVHQFGRVWINDQQYFDGVPLVAWEFYIGGYQPAQKWLKYRKGRGLNFEDILHYQKIIVALTETDRLMKEIDQVEIE